MANVKCITIRAVVPFDLFDRMSAEQAQQCCRWLLAPAVGLSYHWHPVGFEPNAHGGRTATYRLTIVGREAVSFGAFDTLIATLRGVGGVIETQSCVDIEDRPTGSPCPIGCSPKWGEADYEGYHRLDCPNRYERGRWDT